MTTVQLGRRDAVATVTLDRPERLNAISPALAADLIAALGQAVQDPEVRVVILTGSGQRAFCAGDDLKEEFPTGRAEARRLVEQIQAVTRLIMFQDKPVVAAVNGWAVGGGFEWVMNCDLSIWATHAQAFLPEVSLGLGVTGGTTALLPRLVGWQRARGLFFLGEKQSAQALLEMGLAHAVVPGDRLMAEANALADRLAALPPAALRGIKRAITSVHRDELERAMTEETETLVGLLADPAAAERLAQLRARGADAAS
ncbi:MAG: enoyl-CoA hydratase/isomerase family protein [Gemmatimonadetes bacterium]|nr:enoyl-CoA hydratase/isomerase family protein [Gemmatimonadota bacterium]